MNKKAKIILIALALVILISVVVYFGFKAAKKTQQVTQIPLPDSTPKAVVNDNFPLNVGSKGPNVVYLQRALNYIKPSNNLVEDGDFGSKTRIAIITTLPTNEYRLPMDEATLNKIIAKGNKAKIGQ